jgi:hypothetical protein
MPRAGVPRLGRLKEWRWMTYSLTTGLVAFALPSVPNPWGGVFLLLAATVGWMWILLLTRRLMIAAGSGDLPWGPT